MTAANMIPTEWPHRAQSMIVQSAPHRWHVQRLGTGPVALLLHGAGASTHSFAALMTLMSSNYDVIAVDLPGQGFTKLGTRTRCGLAAMADDLAALCAQMNVHPDMLIGHSAGAALAMRLSTLLPHPPARVISINGAFAEFEGLAGVIFPMMAKALTFNPFIGSTFARFAGSRRQVKRLIEGTGSTIPDEGLRHYQTLVSNPEHVDATLAMMAQWDLTELRAITDMVTADCLLFTGGRDKAVPHATSDRFSGRLERCTRVNLPTLGHLAHEEAPLDVLKAVDAM